MPQASILLEHTIWKPQTIRCCIADSTSRSWHMLLGLGWSTHAVGIQIHRGPRSSRSGFLGFYYFLDVTEGLSTSRACPSFHLLWIGIFGWPKYYLLGWRTYWRQDRRAIRQICQQCPSQAIILPSRWRIHQCCEFFVLLSTCSIHDNKACLCVWFSR